MRKPTFPNSEGALAGPIGSVSASDPAAQIGLSADGQSVNLTITTNVDGDITLTWHDPAGAVADFTVVVDTDNGVPDTTVGSFGAFSEGTTA